MTRYMKLSNSMCPVNMVDIIEPFSTNEYSQDHLQVRSESILYVHASVELFQIKEDFFNEYNS